MPDSDPPHRLTRRIQVLFETRRNPATGKLWTIGQAARAITAEAAKIENPEERARRSISTSYLQQLKDGTRWNPTLSHIEMIAWLFRMPVDELVKIPDDDVEGFRQRVLELEAEQDEEVVEIVARVRRMRPGPRRSALLTLLAAYNDEDSGEEQP